jgi:hypothetical protein
MLVLVKPNIRLLKFETNSNSRYFRSYDITTLQGDISDECKAKTDDYQDLQEQNHHYRRNPDRSLHTVRIFFITLPN